uniref:HTH-type transcriptional regulator CbbR n=1 Tax=uncultured Alphaproteobacteria bacterium TaxID=91750 RepID=A0A5Q5AQE4_9PROT|nr:LysR family transcriptional regulator [uncultured Alphaproteobacteria bacterium]
MSKGFSRIASQKLPNITLRQMQIFESVVRLGGYTLAARELNLTQPTVSMQMSKLCEILGLELLEQSGRRTHPTSIGREVYDNMREILDRLADLGGLADDLKGVVRGELKVSVITTAAYFMPHYMGKFIERHPLVQPRLTISNRNDALERLRSNQDDLLIMGKVPDSMPVKAHPFINNEVVVIARPDHPLNGKRGISLEQLVGERFLVREPGSGTRRAVDQLLAKHGLKLTPYMELGNAEAIKQGVLAGLGISVLSRRNLDLELGSNRIVILDVQGFPLVRRWYAVHFRGKRLSLVARTFLEYILNEMELEFS